MSLFRRGRSRAASSQDDAAHAEAVTSDQPETQDTVGGERGIPTMNRRSSLQSRLSNVLAIGLMSALGLGILGWYYVHTYANRSQLQLTAQTAARNKATGDMALPPLGPIEPPQPAAPASKAAAAVESILGPAPPEPPPPVVPKQLAAAGPYATAGATNGAPPEKSPEQLAIERRLAGPVFSTPSQLASPTPLAAADGRSASVLPSAGEEASGTLSATTGSSRLGDLLRPTVTPAARAHVLPTQRLLLPKGAFIDCTLETALNSSLPGMPTCVTATDTFSADGQVVLMERGTKLTGESVGTVQRGSSRIFVLWTEARTPTGVVIPLASPGTDELGRSGLPGEVNRHFFERFGAAILVSVIDGAIQAEVQSRSRGNGTVIYNPSGSQEIMTEVLKDTINVPPTVDKPNGDRIQVLVARDLDFRSVYELRASTRAQ